jgi:hypothetical protein
MDDRRVTGLLWAASRIPVLLTHRCRLALALALTTLIGGDAPVRSAPGPGVSPQDALGLSIPLVGAAANAAFLFLVFPGYEFTVRHPVLMSLATVIEGIVGFYAWRLVRHVRTR